ncbi:MerR family transcriptional regulator [Algoriphagus litoralis]|uniref:MerR family transcriptional regulator n=1 Tax=Algoriphagus litoralis TaxID=2202829 RepID=UPI000DBAA83F|nr:MerR family transcriptional regulator [Algoriphagus litoralis]
MLISELAKRTGLSIHTLRYYENYGLFQGTSDEAVTSNNYKNYDESLVEKITLIKEAKNVGFTLAEIKVMLQGWYDIGFSKEKKMAVINRKIQEVETKILKLQGVKDLLNEYIKDIQDGLC